MFFIFRNSSILPDAVIELMHQIPPIDSTWMEATAKRSATLLEKLDTDLKNYKDNSIKESIRLYFSYENRLC